MIRLARFSFVLVLALAMLHPVDAQELRLPEPVGMTGNPAATLVLEGNTAFTHGDLTAASRDYRTALSRLPDFAIARFNLGLVEIHQGNRERGLADMDRGIGLARAHHMSNIDVRRLQLLRAAFAQTA